MSSLSLATLFFAALAFGSIISFALFPVRSTGKSFIKYYYGFITFFLVIFLLCLWKMEVLNVNYLIASTLSLWIWVLSFQPEFTKNEEILHKVNALLAFLFFNTLAQKLMFHHSMTFLSMLPSLIILNIGMLFLSSQLMNMVFGHWYLVNRSLDIKYLIKTSWMVLGITYLRVLSVAFTVYLIYQNTPSAEFYQLFDLFSGHGIFIWARILAGLGLPLLVAHLSLESAKIGSNQSATGIMYAGTIFVLMGEILALYLYALTNYTW
jgi:hypothetical protein